VATSTQHTWQGHGASQSRTGYAIQPRRHLTADSFRCWATTSRQSAPIAWSTMSARGRDGRFMAAGQPRTSGANAATNGTHTYTGANCFNNGTIILRGSASITNTSGIKCRKCMPLLRSVLPPPRLPFLPRATSPRAPSPAQRRSMQLRCRSGDEHVAMEATARHQPETQKMNIRAL